MEARIGRLRQALRILVHPNTGPKEIRSLIGEQAQRVKEDTLSVREADVQEKVVRYYKLLAKIAVRLPDEWDWLKPYHDTIIAYPGTPIEPGLRISKTGGISETTSLCRYEPEDTKWLTGVRRVHAFDKILDYWVTNSQSL